MKTILFFTFLTINMCRAFSPESSSKAYVLPASRCVAPRSPRGHVNQVSYASGGAPRPARTSPCLLRMGNEDYSREVRLREEAESPFRKVRYFLYLNALGGALSSLFISATRVAAALNGINTDLMQESLINCAVDVAGIVVVAYLYKNDMDAEQSRLKRATKGAELAKLPVRASKEVMGDTEEGTFTTTLGALRRGRGIEKRVVIAAAGKEKIEEILKDATAYSDDLELNDLLVVPVVMPQGQSPSIDLSDVPPSVALPVAVGDNWKLVVDDEAAEAVKQGVDIEKEGFCVVLKKNGRVGQRTRGIFLNNLVGNVVARREAGMDITNI